MGVLGGDRRSCSVVLGQPSASTLVLFSVDDSVAQQLVEALGEDDIPEARHLIRDRDGTYGEVFRAKVDALGLRDVVTPKASPWCNGFAERVIGTIRRECTDHIIPMGERHLLRVLREYARYYNEGRAHLSLGGNSPIPRFVEDEPVHAVVGTPYHSNTKAIEDTYRIMTDLDDHRARQIMARRGVELVLICRGNDYSNILAPGAKDTLYARLKRQAPPAWLRPIVLPAPINEIFMLYSVQPAD